MAKRSDNTADKPGDNLWHPERPMGLARALTKSGHVSRREAEACVAAGRVTVNGKVVTNPRAKVGASDPIVLDGHPLVQLVRSYYAFNKPLRVVCREADAQGRRLAAEYFPADVAGLRTSGRLDSRTSGLVLVSNDAAWNNAVAGDPAIDHEYRVQLEGEMSELELTVMDAGIQLSGTGTFKPRSVTVLEIAHGQTLLRVTVGGGQIRPLRRMFSSLRHKILSLRRVRIGSIDLGTLPMGKLRALSTDQVRELAPDLAGGDDPGS